MVFAFNVRALMIGFVVEFSQKRRRKMEEYSVYVYCEDCGETHPMGICVGLDDGPAKKASIGDAYKGKALPKNIVNMADNKITCPKTGNWIAQRDNKQVFLVPVAKI
jgi:hypothetical protein